MIKIVYHTGNYETYTEEVTQEDGTTKTVEKQREIIEDTKHVGYDESRAKDARLVSDSWNQDAGYTSEGPHYAVVSYSDTPQ